MENLNLEKFNPKKEELIVLANNYKSLLIAGVDDKQGYLIVDAARKDLKAKRVEIEKTGKELRADAIAFQKKVIEVEKELVSIIEPTEIDLKQKQEKIDQEKFILKQKELLPARQEALKEIGVHNVDDNFILLMDENKFTSFFNAKKTEFLNLQFKKIQEEQERIEREKLAIQRAKEIEEAKKQAELKALELAEKKRIEEAARAEQEKKLALELAEKQKQAAIEYERKKAEEEKRKIIQEQERKEAERIAKEKAEKEAIEKAKKEKEEAEKQRQQQAAYIAFLKDNNYQENGQFKLFETDKEIILFKKIASFIK